MDIKTVRIADEVVGPNPRLYDGLEVEGVAESRGGFNVDNSNPQFFSVYARGTDGLAACIGDHATHAEALAYAYEVSAIYGYPVDDRYTREQVRATARNQN